MTLGIALVLIFVLYLIDKNKVWGQAMKVAIGLALLGVVVIAGLYGWTRYSEWRQSAETAKQQVRWQASVNACEERNLGGSTNAIDIAMTTSECEKDPKVVLRNYSAAPSSQPVTPFTCKEWDERGQCTSSVIEIRGGETLKIVFAPNTPKGFRPLVYLGHKQAFALACGDYLEKGTKPRMDANDIVTCP